MKLANANGTKAHPDLAPARDDEEYAGIRLSGNATATLIEDKAWPAGAAPIPSVRG